MPAASQSRIRVVLVRPRNPLNIGAVARAMSNFGFSDLRVVNPYEGAFRGARSAVGAATVLDRTQEYESVADAVADCALVVGTTAVGHRELQHPLMRLEQGAQFIEKHAGRVALLFGSEKTGLSNEDLSYCQWLLHIPTREEHISMNLGQAAAVCLYELTRDPKIPSAQRQGEPATAEHLDRITQLLSEALYTSGYMQAEALPSTTTKVRRLVRRLNPSADDAELILGMLRQISRKQYGNQSFLAGSETSDP